MASVALTQSSCLDVSWSQVVSGGVGGQNAAEVICENKHFCSAKPAFRGIRQMVNAAKTKWKNSYLLPNALQDDVKLCNSYTRKGFSLKWSVPCVCGALRTAAMATMYLLLQGRRKGGEGEKKKRDKWAFERRERGSSASWAELNWRLCADWWHLHMCCLYKYHHNSQQVNFKQKTGREVKSQLTDVRRDFYLIINAGAFF